MKEEVRLETLKRIKEDEEREKLIPTKESELASLEQNRIIQEYFRLKNEVENLRKQNSLFNHSREKIIRLEFIWALNNKNNCSHDYWVYTGSFGLWLDPLSEHDKIFTVSSERSKEFKNNEYRCLECEKVIVTEDWKQF